MSRRASRYAVVQQLDRRLPHHRLLPGRLVSVPRHGLLLAPPPCLVEPTLCPPPTPFRSPHAQFHEARERHAKAEAELIEQHAEAQRLSEQVEVLSSAREEAERRAEQRAEEAESKGATAAQLQAQVTQLEGEVARLSTESDTLIAALDTARADARAALEAQQGLDAFRTEAEATHAAGAAAALAQTQAAKAEEDARAARDEAAAAREEARAAVEAQGALQAELEKVQAVAGSAGAERDQLARLREASSEMDARNRQLANRVDMLERENAKVESRAATLTEQVQEGRARVTELVGTVDEAARREESLGRQLVAACDASESARAELRTSTAQCDRLRDAHAACSGEIARSRTLLLQALGHGGGGGGGGDAGDDAATASAGKRRGVDEAADSPLHAATIELLAIQLAEKHHDAVSALEQATHELELCTTAMEAADKELALDARMKKLRAEAKRERATLVRAVLASMQSLRAHLVLTLSGLREPAPLSARQRDSYVFDRWRQRWGMRTSSGEFDRLVLQLETATDSPVQLAASLPLARRPVTTSPRSGLRHRAAPAARREEAFDSPPTTSRAVLSPSFIPQSPPRRPAPAGSVVERSGRMHTCASPVKLSPRLAPLAAAGAHSSSPASSRGVPMSLEHGSSGYGHTVAVRAQHFSRIANAIAPMA